MGSLLKNKKFLSVYAVWILIHTFLLAQGASSHFNKEQFWPFGSAGIESYDVSEWLVYVFAPITILFLITSFDDKTIKLLLIILCPLFCRAQNYNERINSSEEAARNDSTLKSIEKIKVAEIEKDRVSGVNKTVKNKSNDKDQLVNSDDPVADDLNKAFSQADPQAQYQSRTFKWDDAQMERFKNSPCWEVYGYDPDLTPEQNERRYEQCESEKREETIKKVTTILLIVGAASIIIFFGYKANKKAQT